MPFSEIFRNFETFVKAETVKLEPVVFLLKKIFKNNNQLIDLFV